MFQKVLGTHWYLIMVVSIFFAIISIVLLPYYYFYIFLVSLFILNVEAFVPKKKPVPSWAK